MQTTYTAEIEVMLKESAAKVNGFMTYFHEGAATDQLTFYLHKDFKITTLNGEAVTCFEMDQEGKPLWFLMCSRPVKVSLNHPIKQGETITIHYVYEGHLTFEGFPIGEISEKQVELGFYAPWHLIHETMKPCHFDITVKSDNPECMWVGGTGFHFSSGKGHLKTMAPTIDGYMIGSSLFNEQVVTVKEETFETSVYFIKPEDRPLATFLATSMKGIYDQLSKWFGCSEHTKMSIAILDRKDGGGYNRPGFIVLDREGIHFETEEAIEKMYNFYYSYLAHEAGHLWWHKADVLTWEDWLNESFAEFSSYLAIEEGYSKSISEGKLFKYREAKAKMPAILGLDRESEQAFATLYMKGPALLHDWMELVGRDAFLAFLKEVHLQQVKTTESFIKLCASFFGADFAEQVNKDLRA